MITLLIELILGRILLHLRVIHGGTLVVACRNLIVHHSLAIRVIHGSSIGIVTKLSIRIVVGFLWLWESPSPVLKSDRLHS
jgi:hypothetical protein